MKVLVACEFSGVVREAFRKRGHDAWSLDLLSAKDGSPFHIQAPYGEEFVSGLPESWDLMIAHPPCTYLSNMGNCRINEAGRREKREQAMQLFLAMTQAPIARIAIENPRGYPERAYRLADQIIQPYQFGHPQSKATCLWLKGLPRLVPTEIVKPQRKWDGKRWRTFVDRLPSSSPRRSITFQGIAEAMADQWGAPGPTPKETRDT